MTWSNRGLILSGLALCLTLIGGLTAWGLGTTLAGAVIVRGELRPAGASQPVEVLEAARIAAVRVREGEVVAPGDVLVVLDAAEVEAAAAALDCEIAALTVRTARLQAERDGAESFMPGPEPGCAAHTEAELFTSGHAHLAASLKLLAEQASQAERQVAGTRDRLARLDDEIVLVAAELARSEALTAKGLVPESTLAGLRQQLTQLAGRRSEFETAITLAAGQAQTYRDEAARLQAERRDSAARALAETGALLRQLTTDRAALGRRLERMTLTARVAGVVHLAETTLPGAVVRPGQPVLSLIPLAEPTAELYVTPAEIGAVRLGQAAVLRPLALTGEATPELSGSVTAIGADLIRLGEASVYRVTVTIPADDLASIGPVRPGTPVEAYLATEARTPFSYLARPFTDYFAHALRD